MILILMFIFIWICCIGFTMMVAKAKNRSVIGWGALAFLFGAFAVIGIAIMPKGPTSYEKRKEKEAITKEKEEDRFHREEDRKQKQEIRQQKQEIRQQKREEKKGI